MDAETSDSTQDNDQTRNTESTIHINIPGEDDAEQGDNSLCPDGGLLPEQSHVEKPEQIQAIVVAGSPEQGHSSLTETGCALYGSSPGKSNHHVTFSNSTVDSHCSNRYGFRRWSWSKGNTDLQEKKVTRDRPNRCEVNHLEDYDTAYVQFQQSAPFQMLETQNTEISANKSQMDSINEYSEIKSRNYSPINPYIDSSYDKSSDIDASSTSSTTTDCQRESPFVFPTVKDISPRTSEFLQNAFSFPSTGLFQRRRLRSGVLRLQNLDELLAGRQSSAALHDSLKEGRVETPQVVSELRPLTCQANADQKDRPSWKHYRRHFSSGDASNMATKRPTQLLFPPRIFVGGVIRKSYR